MDKDEIEAYLEGESDSIEGTVKQEEFSDIKDQFIREVSDQLGDLPGIDDRDGARMEVEQFAQSLVDALHSVEPNIQPYVAGKLTAITDAIKSEVLN